MVLYTCRGCNKPIPAENARVRCQTCADYNLCANCFLVGQITVPHAAIHQTTLFKLSGYVEGTAAGASLSQLSRIQQQQQQVQQQGRPSPFGQQGSGMGGGGGMMGQTAQTMPMSMPSIPGMPFATAAPPMQASGTGQYGLPQQSTGYSGYSGVAAQQGMNSMATGLAGGLNRAPTGGAWQTFFNQSDWTPTQSFTSLAQAFFTHLDTNRTGYLTPEQYSAFLDSCGYPPTQNTWRNALNSVHPYSTSPREMEADAALKRAYDSFGIEHQIGQRSNSGMSYGNTMGSVNTPMPLITLNGFVKLTGYEVLFDPTKGHADLNRGMKNLGLPLGRERGEIPRWVLPEGAPQGILQRAQQVQRQATQQSGGPLQMGGTVGNQGMNVGSGGPMYQVRLGYR
jgi:hypothetical protein